MKEAFYLYGVISFKEPKEFQTKGIGDKKVEILTYKDIGALVHRCRPIPFDTKDAKKAAEWIEAHNRVITDAWETGSAILPFSFNTIVKATAKKDALDNVMAWLKEKYDVTLKKIKELEGKAEFGVQIFWNKEEAASQLLKQESSLLALQKEAKNKGEGAGFLIQEKMQKELRLLLEKKGLQYTEEILDKIKGVVSDYKIEKAKEEGVILCLSCLTEMKNPKLEGILDEIQSHKDLKVRFTGPWPPYSFVRI